MALLFAGVLICSFGIQKLMSPVSDAVLQIADGTEFTVTGTVATAGARYVLANDRALYRLKNPAAAARFAGRRVRICGILHSSTGLLDVKAISAIEQSPRSRS